MDLPNPMDDCVAPAEQHVAMQFLRTVVDERDLILFRPIETWNEGGRKRTRVLFKQILYRQSIPSVLSLTIAELLQTSADEKANVFFGVCPRFGDGGRFDQAWQIRVVRCLWADIDYICADDALKRVTDAGLPPPSIVVNSGNGIHLYWLLSEPYLIDDVDDPPPVCMEWVQAPGGRKKPRKYIQDGDERIYLDTRKYATRLSPKAQDVEDVLTGVAGAIGGDHTTDLSRLLRVPGTLNRKNERNGQSPLPTELLICDSGRKYQLADFQHLATPSPQRQRQEKIAAMPLPAVRKPSAAKADKLSERIAACAIAQTGARSEADFALCCLAIRSGLAKEELFTQVSGVGKFAEAGSAYFDRTWENSEYEVRARLLDKIENANEPAAQTSSDGRFEVQDWKEGTHSANAVIHIDAENVTVSTVMGQITDQFLAATNCFLRSGQVTVVRNQTIAPIMSAAELGGLLNSHVEFFIVEREGGQYKPLPLNYGNTWLHHPGEKARLPPLRLFSHNPVYAADWRLLGPGYDEASGIYYAGDLVEPRDGTKHLDTLLQDFCFKSVSDRTNYLGFLLTTLLIVRFIGSKPIALFNGNQPDLGKSILAQIIAIVRDGAPVETISYNPNDEEFEKSLGATVKSGITTIIVDNAKARGRNPYIESGCLERSATDATLSYRLLGYSDRIRAENSHIFCITANTPDVSRDLMTRSVVINLEYEGNPTRRHFEIEDPEGYAEAHRPEILGELIGMVERWKASGMPLAKTHSRFNKKGWGNIIGGILAACGEPDFLANADEASDQLDGSRREFRELVTIISDHEQGTFTASDLAGLARRHRLLSGELGDGSERSQATRMGVLAGRFVAERFELSPGVYAVFHRADDRKGKVYHVEVVGQLPNSAERRANVWPHDGSAA